MLLKRDDHPGGYMYSHFFELDQTWRRLQNVTLRQEYRAGKRGFVDWAAPSYRFPTAIAARAKRRARSASEAPIPFATPQSDR
jgi:hypothetical protein